MTLVYMARHIGICKACHVSLPFYKFSCKVFETLLCFLHEKNLKVNLGYVDIHAWKCIHLFERCYERGMTVSMHAEYHH